MRLVWLLTIACAITHCFGLRAQGTLRWSWRFDQTSFVVGPSDWILLTATATIINNPGAVPFAGGVSANFSGDLQKIYSFTFGRTGSDFGEEFFGERLFPGQEISFLFGVLTPISTVKPGTYRADPATLGFHGVNKLSENTFTIVVVPEPPTIAVLTLGILLVHGGTFVRKWRGRAAPSQFCL
jgi:hypothetical protein